MQNLDEKKSIMTKILDYDDHDSSDWGSFSDDDINISCLEQSLQTADVSDSSNEIFNDKFINSLQDSEFFQNMDNLDEDISTFCRIETSCKEPVKALNDEGISCPQSFFKEENTKSTFKTAYKLPSSGNFHNTDTHLLNPAIKDICTFPEKGNLYSVTEKSYNSQDYMPYKCTAREQTIIIQEYPSKDYINPESGILKEVGPKYSECLPHISSPEIFNTQKFIVSTQGSSRMIISNQVSSSNQKNTTCNESNTTYQRITSSEENFDSQSMIISSQGSSDSQRMIISSQGSSDSQRMIISSQGSSDSQRMIISSQESFDSQEMVTSSQGSFDNQKMITSSQEKFDHQKMTISSQESFDSQEMVTSSQGSFDGQKIITSSQEKFDRQKMTTSSQECFDSQKVFISHQGSNIKNLGTSSQETSMNHKMFNSRPESFLKITKKINFKKERKSYQCMAIRLAVSEKKQHKFLDFKRIEKAMKIENVNTAIEDFRSLKFNRKYGDTVASKKILRRELKVTKRENAVKKREKLATAREADIQKYENTLKTRRKRIS